MSEIFVSHSSKDRDFVVNVILPMLSAQGWSPWYSDERITAAEEWQRKIVAGLEDCPWFLVVLSPNAVASRWVLAEVDWAFENRVGRIIPLLYQSCEVHKLHLLLRSLQRVEFTKDSEEDRARVIRQLTRMIGGDVPPAAPPGKPVSIAPAAPALPQNVTDSLGLEMIWCPPGKFLMGSPVTESGRSENEHQHEVTLTKGFWISRYQVTQRQWETLMGGNPSYFKASGPDAPVEMVNWDDCMEFCRKLNEREGDGLPPGYAYRLPAEAQWEYACRAGTATPFHFGTVLDGTQANCDGNYPYGTEKKGPYLQKTVTVGSYAPNNWGLHDMHGNVWEWCLDWYGEYERGAVPDPTGSKQATSRVIRGGSCGNLAQYCRSAYRSSGEPDCRDRGLGFRPVRSA